MVKSLALVNSVETSERPSHHIMRGADVNNLRLVLETISKESRWCDVSLHWQTKTRKESKRKKNVFEAKEREKINNMTKKDWVMASKIATGLRGKKERWKWCNTQNLIGKHSPPTPFSTPFPPTLSCQIFPLIRVYQAPIQNTSRCVWSICLCLCFNLSDTAAGSGNTIDLFLSGQEAIRESWEIPT